MNNLTNHPQDYQPIPSETTHDMFLDIAIEKRWWQSRTIWGGLVASGAGIVGSLGYTLDVPLTTDLMTGIAGLLGGVLAIVGRIRANSPIAVRKPRK